MASTTDLLADLRHDLCNPINQILGYSELLEEELAEGEAADPEDLRKIQQAAHTLLAMVRSRLTDALLEPIAEEAIHADAITPVDGPQAPRTADAPPLRKGRILAVDDDALNLDLLAQRLARQGHMVSTAVDGEQALQRLREQPFDLVLLDVMMPKLDGYGTLAGLKADEKLRAIPVIMISALDELSSVVRCIEAGAEDYLPKPFNPTLLRARIGACLEKKALHDQELELYNSLVQSQRELESELSAAHRGMAELDLDVRSDPKVAPLMRAFERMTSAMSRRQSDLRATIQDLEIQINRKSLSSQVKTIVTDPTFSAFTERAKAMRARRQAAENR
uniref:response regulator n=1 Tax=Cyanobium sp. TaxID=2164130 RepID=UPI00404759E1